MPDSGLISGVDPSSLLTDPLAAPLLQRYALARSLYQQSTADTPTTGIGALARALTGYVAGQRMNDATQQAQDLAQQRQRAFIAAFNPGSTSPSPAPAGTPSPQSSSPLIQSLTTPQSMGPSGITQPQLSQLPQPNLTGVPQGAPGAPGTILTRSMMPPQSSPQGGSAPPQQPPMQPPPQMAPGQTAQSTAAPTAYAQMQGAGQRLLSSSDPVLSNKGEDMLLQMRQQMAGQQISGVGELLKQGLNYDSATGATSPVANYAQNQAALAEAKARGAKLGELDPSVTAGQLAQTNALNTGTAQTAAQKAGLVAGSEAGARNASDLQYAGPLTTAKETATKAADLNANPAIAAATTAATNQANAAKPPTPVENIDLTQKANQAFMDNPQVKEHYEIAKNFKSVLAAAQSDNKASDINLVDGLVKMFNPGATVRQGTFDNFMKHTQGMPDNVMGIVKSYFGSGEHLAPETRQQLIQQATTRMDSSRGVYNQFANFATATAQANGLDPSKVVPTFVDPLSAREEMARRAVAKQQSAGAPP